MSSTFGTLFRVTTFGESHGRGVGAVIDGCPPGLALTEADVQHQLDRRRPGQSAISTPRNEQDAITIYAGWENGRTLGTPLVMVVMNRDQRPGDYREMHATPRPSHADYTYQAKYGSRASSGGGRASARETIGRVAAGAVAEVWLRAAFGIEIVAWVSAVGDVALPDSARADAAPVPDPAVAPYTRAQVDATPVRCPDPDAAAEMIRLIESVKDRRDSIGGLVTCVCRNVPAGWGDPVFDKLEASLARAMLSIPAARGFDFGSGFAAARMRGSKHNDVFIPREQGLGTCTNHSGGIQGGIANGETIYFRVPFKPPATIGLPQNTVDFQGSETVLEGKGRHDPCVVPRAVPVVEAMAALVLADAALRQQALAQSRLTIICS